MPLADAAGDIKNQFGIGSKMDTTNKLAGMSGITQSTLSNIIGGRNHGTTIATIKKICDGLDITIQEFFDSKVFCDLEQEIR